MTNNKRSRSASPIRSTKKFKLQDVYVIHEISEEACVYVSIVPVEEMNKIGTFKEYKEMVIKYFTTELSYEEYKKWASLIEKYSKAIGQSRHFDDLQSCNIVDMFTFKSWC